MLNDLQAQINSFLSNSVFYLKPWSIIIAGIWGINIVNWIIGSPLNKLAIIPRQRSGLLGIFLAPILHRDFTHLLFNSIPLFVMGLALLLKDGTFNFCGLTLSITVISGLGTWLIARKGIHLGASGLISGYFGYILISAFTAPSLTTILFALLAIYYFGGIFMGLLPKEKETSWEGHFLGFLSGMLCGYYPNVFVYFIHP